jgi:serine/threonine protein kinase
VDIPKNPEAPTRTLLPNERVGQCVIETLIDEDKSGRVYKAFHEAYEKHVCLKIISPDLSKNASFLDVLRIQMQTARSVQHKGIADVYEIGKSDGCQFVISEWSPSGLLSQQVVQNEKFSLPEALDIAIKTAQALQAAAAMKIFHGNLRLNSILIYPDGAIKISEIGFVAAVRALFGPANLPVYLGAARFLAPEMTSPGVVDHRADIYSLGLILYFLLFSTTPFRFEGEKLTASGEWNEFDSAKDLLKVVSKMTENDPAKRYQDYESLLEDLRTFFTRSMGKIGIPFVKRSIGEAIKRQQLFRVLCALYASGADGTLTATEGEIRRTFYIRKKEIVYFESTHPEEDIWNRLIEKGELDPKQRPGPNESMARAINRMAAQELMRYEDFQQRYQELAARAISEALNQPNGDAEFVASEIGGDALCIVRLNTVLLKAARYQVDLKDVLAEIRSESFLHRTGLFDSLTSGFSLGADESLLMSVSQDGIYTGSLQTSSGSSNERGIRFLYLLKVIGALEMKTSQEASAAQAAPVEQKFVLEAAPSPEPIDIKKGSVRVEVQRSATKVDSDRLDLEAEKRYENARACYANSKFWEAAKLCEQALALHEDFRYYWLMGLSYSKHPKFRHKAEDCFHRAINLDPLNDEMHCELADFYMTHGLLLRARTHCMKALEIIPGQLRANEILASPVFASLPPGGCCCEHDPGCNHEEHRAWRRKP